MLSKDTKLSPWLVTAVKQPDALVWTPAMQAKRQDTDELLLILSKGSGKERILALAILGRLRGISIRFLSLVLPVSRATIFRKWKRFREFGASTVFDKTPTHPKKVDDETIRQALFALTPYLDG